ncbi:hypothetical protein [Gemmata massiliana]|uniref:hypothetical protein n=1 Tax=Gemmata massiliana TaxID=1210884 RepID=UPI0013A6E1BC|nr:hypothetical protein [Gemmata massiliana]
MVHSLLTIALVGCCGYLLWRDSRRSDAESSQRRMSERLSAHEDMPVRHFLDVKWLGGDYELPAGEDHCGVALLRFEEGKLTGRRGIVFSPKPGASRVVPFYVMWGRGKDGPRVVSGWPWNWGGSNGDPFYADLGDKLSRSYGDSPLGDLRGYRVIGHAVSKQLRAGREQFVDAVIGYEDVIKNHQRVLVLGVKPFPTREEAEHWLDGPGDHADP